ncbi:MAG: ABC transporter ATP-binding protein, partial [Desulfurococcaceae archaeon]
MSFMELRNIYFYYTKDKPVLKELNLKVERGELLALLGESGSGKSTLLKIIAGFLRPSSGRVLIDGKDFTEVPPHKRDVGIVFQNYALFPHMSVFENIMYGLKVRGISRDEANERVNELLEVLNIKDLANKKPTQLSGGQQQRVAIARALAIRPKILLMDEPMSNIDPKLRSKLRVEIKRIQREFNITTVYVTHDQDDAFEIGDRIAVLHDGSIEKVDTPLNILNNPETYYVASFLGYENILPISTLLDAFKAFEEVLREKE